VVKIGVVMPVRIDDAGEFLAEFIPRQAKQLRMIDLLIVAQSDTQRGVLCIRGREQPRRGFEATRGSQDEREPLEAASDASAFGKL